MRIPTTTRPLWIAASVAVIAGLAVVGGLSLGSTSSSDPSSSLSAGELEPERQTAGIAPKSDSEMEDLASRPIQTVVAARNGDTLMDILLRAGVERMEAVKAIDALREIFDPRALKVGQKVTVTFERPSHGIGSGPFHAVTLQPDPRRLVSAKRDENGYAVRETKRKETMELVRAGGVIRSSLFESARAGGVPSTVLVEMIKAFSYDVDFQRDIQPGDRFEVMFERFVDNKGQTIRTGELLFANLTLSGTPTPIYRYVDASGHPDYYNLKGESVRKALLRTPVDGVRITSSFGMRRHPILGYSKMHKGVDFGVTTGTPVMAAGDGVIDMAGDNGSYGNYVRIRHDDRHATAYAHLSRIAQGVRKGARVRQGQIIAYSGSTGRSTGPHLHYEVLVSNQQVNPLSVKFQSGTKLAGRDLSRFQTAMHETNVQFAQLPTTHRVVASAKNPPASLLE